MKIARVFPRRTKATPADPLAFTRCAASLGLQAGSALLQVSLVLAGSFVVLVPIAFPKPVFQVIEHDVLNLASLHSKMRT